MVAHGAEHAWLQISIGHIVGKAADVQFCVMVAVRIAANDKHMLSAVTSHVGQRNGLVVEDKVRVLPRHAALKRGRADKQIP